MAKAYQLLVRARGDASDYKKATRQMSRATRDLKKAVGVDFGRIAKAGSMAIGAGFAATVAIGIKKLSETQRVYAQTAAVIESTGGAAGVTAKHVGDLADAIASKTGVDDDAIQAGQNLLLTFKGIQNQAGKGNDIFDRTTQVMTDMAVAMGTDQKQAALQLGKALNDPAKGLTALTRSGVSFTAAEKEKIKALVESGDTLGAQKVMLKALDEQFAGSAEAFGKTLPGRIAILRQTLDEMAMQIVKVLIPAGESLILNAQEIMLAIKAWAESKQGQQQLRKLRSLMIRLGRVIGRIAQAALDFGRKMYEWRDILIPIGVAIGAMIVALRTWRIVTAAVAAAQAALNVVLAANPVGLVVLAVIGLVAALTYLWKTNEGFRELVKKVWSGFLSGVKAVWGWVKNLIKQIGPGLKKGMQATWRAIRPILGYLWAAIKKVASIVIKIYATYLRAWWATIRTLWGVAKPILSALFHAWWNVAKKVMEVYRKIWDFLKPGIEWIKDKGTAAIGKLKDAFEKVWGYVKKVADKLDFIKDGLGAIKSAAGGVAGAFGFGGEGNGSTVGPLRHVSNLEPMAAAFGLTTTSGFRPGDPGWHGQNRARDFSNGVSTPQMKGFAAMLAAVYGSQLKELIYTPLGFGIKNGAMVPMSFFGSDVAAAHYNHVHVAYARGGIATRPHVGLVGEAGPEAIVPLGSSARARADRRRVMSAAGLGGTTINVYGITDPIEAASVVARKQRMMQPARSY